MNKLLRVIVFLGITLHLSAQTYSPKLLREGQPDSSDLKKFAESIYSHAGAHTEKEKAESIWRFFLTDGRFVKPGFWYHIAGWTYEEPTGEVLDPIKLLNSYGFGLCYHIAPLLEAVFDAGGFADSRCWFLTGHTVAEVFYDGGYHYFDSDMMGYNVAGEGSYRGKPVVGVHALEKDANIILGKLQSPDRVKPGVVDSPWYPADVNAKAMGDMASLFTTTQDNYLYPFTRYAPGHRMDFALRRGEKLTRFFKPEEPGLFYLPYKFDGKQWSEFPREFSEYQIRTADGPHSQKDDRKWATGRIEYEPPSLPDRDVTIIDMPSPYVIIDAQFSLHVQLPSAKSSVSVDTSIDSGVTWQKAAAIHGLTDRDWTIEPQIIVNSTHGRLTAVSGSYDYKVRITKSGDPRSRISSLRLVTRIQLNPRTLPAVGSGENKFFYSSAASVERLAIPIAHALVSTAGLATANEAAQPFLHPLPGKAGEALYSLEADGRALSSFEVGARFLDLRQGLAPDKLTAETRPTSIRSAVGPASISWSKSQDGPFQEAWRFPEKMQWRDGDQIDRLLVWPEVLKRIDIPVGVKKVYVKIRSAGPAFDSVRLAVYAVSPPPDGKLVTTQVWREAGIRKQHVEQLDAHTREHHFAIKAGAAVQNEAIIFANR